MRIKKSPQLLPVGISCYFSAKLQIANQADKGFHFKKQSDWKILSIFLIDKTVFPNLVSG